MHIAKENPLWGFRRNVGKLKTLVLPTGASTVKCILREFGVFPASEKSKKKPPLPWSTFIHVHLDSMVACDFFSKTV